LGRELDETCHTNHSVFFIKDKENDQADISDTDDIGEKSVDQFNDLLQSFNAVIEWAEEKSFSINEIIFLQTLRTRLLSNKFDNK